MKEVTIQKKLDLFGKKQAGKSETRNVQTDSKSDKGEPTHK